MNTSSTRNWLITGGSGGMGSAIARAAIHAGDTVIATARNPEAMADLAGSPGALLMALDVTDSAAIARVVQAAQEKCGRIDVLVNCAGEGLLGAVEETSEAEISACMAVNFRGPLQLMQAVAPLFRCQSGGHVINISAAAAIANYPGFAIYGAAKAALEFASESYRLELAPFGVMVTLVEPGPFRTGFIGRSMKRAASRMADYDATSGKFGALLEKMDGRQPGDPDKAARIIVEMVHAGRAPLRLPLGRYAFGKARGIAAQRLRELDEWESTASATDFNS